MFTGLVEGIGVVVEIIRKGADAIIRFEPEFDMTGVRLGDSIAVNGACLTVTEINGSRLSMDISAETLKRTTLNLLKQGHTVNLERALRFSDRLGGHLVSGHIDGVGRILNKSRQGRSSILTFGIDKKLSRYIIEKGSIAVDGISLTVNRCDDNSFDVNIIPQTGKETGLLKKNTGDPVNIETDVIGKYVEKILLHGRSVSDNKISSGIDLNMLIKNGFGV